MLTDLELMKIHVRALFTHNAESRLLFVNEPDNIDIPAPRLFLGRTRSGNVWRFRANLPESMIEELDALCASEPLLEDEVNSPPLHAERYVRLLEKHAPIEEISSGPAYYFSEHVNSMSKPIVITENDSDKLRGGFEDFISELPAWQPFVALIEDGCAVSVCRSARILPEAHEAGVETLPKFRGRGYAKEVTAEWAHRVQSTGAIPLYSTSWENTASQAVARKLRLKFYGSDFQLL